MRLVMIPIIEKEPSSNVRVFGPALPAGVRWFGQASSHRGQRDDLLFPRGRQIVWADIADADLPTLQSRPGVEIDVHSLELADLSVGLKEPDPKSAQVALLDRALRALKADYRADPTSARKRMLVHDVQRSYLDVFGRIAARKRPRILAFHECMRDRARSLESLLVTPSDPDLHMISLHADGFTGTNGDYIDGRTMDDTLGLWEADHATRLTINSNRVRSDGNWSFARDANQTPSDWQHASVSVYENSSGPCVRMGSTTFECYIMSNGGPSTLYYYDGAGNFTQLAYVYTSSGLRVDAHQTRITGWANYLPYCPVEDSTLATGVCGFGTTSPYNAIDDFASEEEDPSPTIPTINVIAFYGMEESGSGQRNDSAPNRLHLTTVVNATDAAGVNGGNSLSLSGTGYLSTPYSSYFDPSAVTNGFLVSAWARPTALSGDQYVATNWTYAWSGTGGWALFLTGNQARFYMRFSGSGWVAMYPGLYGGANTWMHIAGWWSKNNNTLNFAVNGVILTPTSVTGTPYDTDPGSPMVVGEYPSASGRFSGRIDELLIADADPDQDMIDYLYGDGYPPPYADWGQFPPPGVPAAYFRILQQVRG